MEDEYRICSRCVMDTTDADISFDIYGICNHCKIYDELMKRYLVNIDLKKQELKKLLAIVKKEGEGKEYDCIIGVSGGVDSSYVAYKVKELGLRPLAIHLDNGWDSEIAVTNIENLIKKLNIDLYTYVINWEEFRDIQLSFLKASTPDAEIPTDHAILAILRQIADKHNVKHIITGCNIRTETHLPKAWSQGHWDWKYIKNIHNKFGKIKLKTFPHTDLLTFFLHYKMRRQIDILNYLDYVKKDAVQILKQKFNWKPYGGKHYESIYTRFYQGYILPKKFKYDKRRAHFSSLICSGEMTREEALEELKKEPYPLEVQEADKSYVIKKFGLTNEEFENIMSLPVKTYWDYSSYGKLFRHPIYKLLHKLYIFSKYSFSYFPNKL